jgi:electron transport complex protein RnfG
MTDETPTELETSTRLHAGIKALRDAPVGHGVLLALFAMLSALILTMADGVTRDPIAQRMAEDLNASLSQVIPPALYDNDLTTSVTTLDDPVEGAITVYRAARGGAVTAVAFETVSFGYSGAIRVLLGVDPNGQLLGARILAHTETPGLGDKIEIAKDDWITGFDGLSLANTPLPEWKVKKDGGRFDQFSGATITPRAVVDAVRRGLELFDRNRPTLLEDL